MKSHYQTPNASFTRLTIQVFQLSGAHMLFYPETSLVLHAKQPAKIKWPAYFKMKKATPLAFWVWDSHLCKPKMWQPNIYHFRAINCGTWSHFLGNFNFNCRISLPDLFSFLQTWAKYCKQIFCFLIFFLSAGFFVYINDLFVWKILFIYFRVSNLY